MQTESGNDCVLILGLGNPGDEYYETRHNIGFMVVDAFARRHAERGFEPDVNFHQTIARYMQRDVLLAKPMTYMNASGEAVEVLVDRYRPAPERLMIVYDDVDLPLGAIRLRKQGGSGGHRGMESVITHLGTLSIPRLRCGIGAPPDDMDTADYVLSPFEPEEEEIARDMVERAVVALESWIESGIEKTMALYNYSASNQQDSSQ